MSMPLLDGDKSRPESPLNGSRRSRDIAELRGVASRRLSLGISRGVQLSRAGAGPPYRRAESPPRSVMLC
jgi:hypothetical protein